MTVAMVDWTQVLVALVVGIPATIGAIFGGIVLLRTRTPSGQRIGTLTEQTNHLAHANTAITKDIHDAVTNGKTPNGPNGLHAAPETPS